MKLLIIATGIPFPPDHGRRLRLLHLYRDLASKHSLYWLCPTEDSTSQDIRSTEAMVNHLQCVSHQQSSGRLASIRRAIWDPYPLESSICAALLDLLSKEMFDAVLVDSEAMAAYVRFRHPKIPWILNTHNIPSIIAERTFRTNANLRGRLLGFASWLAMLRFQRRWFPRYSVLTFVSGQEQQWMKQHFPDLMVYELRNGVDAEAISNCDHDPSPAVLNFTGPLGYGPNRDALDYFCAEIMPRILAKRPDVLLRLVGRGTDLYARTYSGRLPVEGLGYVTDPWSPLCNSTLAIAPHRIGGGTRIKILEALAAGKPVVATQVGAEGIQLGEAEGLMVADTPADFAHQVLRVLNDPEIRERAKTVGRPAVIRCYSWQQSRDKLGEILEQFVSCGQRRDKVGKAID